MNKENFNLMTDKISVHSATSIGQYLALLEREPLMDIRGAKNIRDDSFEMGQIATGNIYLKGRKVGSIAESTMGGEEDLSMTNSDSEKFDDLIHDIELSKQDIVDGSYSPPRPVNFGRTNLGKTALYQVYRELELKDLKSACNKRILFIKSDKYGRIIDTNPSSVVLGKRKSGYMKGHDERIHDKIIDYLDLKDGEKVIVLNSFFAELENFTNAEPDYSIDGMGKEVDFYIEDGKPTWQVNREKNQALKESLVDSYGLVDYSIGHYALTDIATRLVDKPHYEARVGECYESLGRIMGDDFLNERRTMLNSILSDSVNMVLCNNIKEIDFSADTACLERTILESEFKCFLIVNSFDDDVIAEDLIGKEITAAQGGYVSKYLTSVYELGQSDMGTPDLS